MNEETPSSLQCPAPGWFKAPSGNERTWLGMAVVWCLILSLMMPYWHFRGKQNSTGEAYKVKPADFIKRHNLVRPVLGVVVPAYRGNFFFKDRTGNTREKKGRWFTGAKARKLVPEEERGHLLTYLQCCWLMASGVRRLHFAGLAHSDLSHNNVLIDPKHGDACVIDCDSLVVPGLAPPTVMGTPGYIAPEVVAGRKQPSIETDLHALAVLIYETLLLRHPLAGPKVRSTRSPEEDDLLSMGAQALYVEHPTDASNHLKPAPEIPVKRLGPYLEKLFIKTFVVGLHAPHLRASASEWEKGLQKTLDLIHPSPDGRNWFIVTPGMPLECPFAKRKLAAPVPVASFLRHIKRPGSDTLDFKDDEHALTVWNGQYLYPWHARSNVSPLSFPDRRCQLPPAARKSTTARTPSAGKLMLRPTIPISRYPR